MYEDRRVQVFCYNYEKVAVTIGQKQQEKNQEDKIGTYIEISNF
jgi:hypothetical protein